MGQSKVTVIVGGQFGDEGKGKFVHYLVNKGEANIVGRGNGGPNAGHNVHDPARGIDIALHLMPSGIAVDGVVNVVGSGTVINPLLFLEEMEAVAAAGIKVTPDNLKLSSRAHIILQGHRELDGATDRVGSTKQGIGPTYSEKITRLGLRLESMLRPSFAEEARTNLTRHNAILVFEGAEDMCLNVDEEVAKLVAAAEKLRPYISDTVTYVAKAMRQGKTVLAEGAQATLLDINFGTYPYVTSSSTIASGIVGGLGIPGHFADRVIGVFKLPMTRVGKGPFVTKLTDAESDTNLKLAGIKGAPGAEFGATTGRARDIGWMDLVSARYANMVNGFTDIGLTKLDSLSGIKTLKVATAYTCDGKVLDTMPADTQVTEKCEPVYTELPGWDEDISGVRDFAALPKAAQDYVAFIEKGIGVPVTMIGTGPNNDDMIVR
jgi:adenylosuccinate synthase